MSYRHHDQLPTKWRPYARAGSAAAGVLLAASCSGHPKSPMTESAGPTQPPTVSASPQPTSTLNLDIFRKTYPHCTPRQLAAALPNYAADAEANQRPDRVDASYRKVATAALRVTQSMYGVAEPSGFFEQVIDTSTNFVGVRYLYDHGNESTVECTAFSLILQFAADHKSRTIEVYGQKRTVLDVSAVNHLTMPGGQPVTAAAAADFNTIAAYSAQGFAGQVVGAR